MKLFYISTTERVLPPYNSVNHWRLYFLNNKPNLDQAIAHANKAANSKKICPEVVHGEYIAVRALNALKHYGKDLIFDEDVTVSDTDEDITIEFTVFLGELPVEVIN